MTNFLNDYQWLREAAVNEGGRAKLAVEGYANADTAYYFAREAAHWGRKLLVGATVAGIGPGRWDSSKLARDQERAAVVNKLVEAWL